VITDLGSGMNYRKKGLKKLILAILRGEVGRIVLVTKDRLRRFGSELLFSNGLEADY
jgi:predicted site-specific integrase-resolvase